MQRCLFLALCLMVVTGTVQANTSQSGLKAYLRLCKHCHGPVSKGTRMQTAEGWRTLFSDNDRLLRDRHRGNAKATKQLTSRYYERHREHLRALLIRYASDSGMPPVDPGSCIRW